MKATDERLAEEDWQSFMEICDLVNAPQTPAAALQEFVMILTERLGHCSANVARLASSLLKCVAINCKPLWQVLCTPGYEMHLRDVLAKQQKHPEHIQKTIRQLAAELPAVAVFRKLQGEFPEPTAQPAEKAKEVVALYGFTAREPGELSFACGDRLVVLEEAHSDWWRGRVKGASAVGVFPSNYVRAADPPPAQQSDDAAERLLVLISAADPQRDSPARSSELQRLYQEVLAQKTAAEQSAADTQRQKSDLECSLRSLSDALRRAQMLLSRA